MAHGATLGHGRQRIASALGCGQVKPRVGYAVALSFCLCTCHAQMVEVNESLAGDPKAVPAEVYEWAANQVYKLAREQGGQPEGFWENASGTAPAGGVWGVIKDKATDLCLPRRPTQCIPCISCMK